MNKAGKPGNDGGLDKGGFEALLLSQQEHFQSVVRHTSWRERVGKLRKIRNYIFSNKAKICEALYKDFRKPAAEVIGTELLPLGNELGIAIRNLDLWMKQTNVSTPFAFVGAKSWVIHEPKGVILIISPWNYPFLLTLGPLISAIASGNCAILKPSELTPHSSAFLKKIVEELFSENEFAVLEGDLHISQALLELPFDHIHFTGSPSVGKVIMQAAAKQLIPVSLELGGENPAIVDKTASLKDAAQKIVWGKFLNSGQSCVAVNHVLADTRIIPDLVDEIQKQIKKCFGEVEKLNRSDDLTGIINERHFLRLKALMEVSVSQGAKIFSGGTLNEEELYFSPTILTDVNPNHPVVQEEIFGPILPILAFRNLDEAIEMVNRKPNALALYIFSHSGRNIRKIVSNTRAGSTCINETKIQFANPHLPFGGAGYSGIGRSHDKAGFMEFSNSRAMLRNRVGPTFIKLFYAPYRNWKEKFLAFIGRRLG